MYQMETRQAEIGLHQVSPVLYTCVSSHDGETRVERLHRKQDTSVECSVALAL